MSASEWRERLAERMPPDLAEEIDIFEAQLELRRQDRIEERVFAETRLRRGVYGQRYDNGQRHDGVATPPPRVPGRRPHQGPRDPLGRARHGSHQDPLRRLHPEQLDVMAELAEEYSDGILHITTRQDVQLHYVHIDDTPDLMRRLAAVDITTREACGNGVRNVTGCPLAGVCHTEAFDVTAYADALFRFLLGHPDCQDFGRKFKIAFSGCAGEACGLVMMHDFGAIARSERGGRRGAPLLRPLGGRRPRHHARTRRSCSTRTPRWRSCSPRCRPSPASSAASARRPTATGPASSSWSPSSASTSSAAWWTRSAPSSRTTTAGPRTSPASSASTRAPRARPCPSTAPPRPRASPSGSRPTCTASASPATRWPPSPCPWATCRPTRPGAWGSSPAATWATRCAPRWSRTSSCAG